MSDDDKQAIAERAVHGDANVTDTDLLLSEVERLEARLAALERVAQAAQTVMNSAYGTPEFFAGLTQLAGALAAMSEGQ